MSTGTNNRDPRNANTQPKRLVLWAALGVLAALFVAGAIVSGMFFLSNSDAVSQLAKAIAQGEKAVGADTASVQGTDGGGDLPTKQASDPRFAFLLMGYGGAGHDGAYLTDSMMVVIVDPSQKTLALLSLPRDAWVPILFDGQKPVYNKLNTAYAFGKDSSLYTNRLPRYKGGQGAGTLSMDTVSRILGIPVSYYLGLDFAGFKEAINTVGGVDVDIPDSFSAEYPANDDPSIDPSWKVVRFRKGVEHMNGERAIEYSRARETIDNISEGSDFARSRRQRLIMEAFKTKLLTPEGLMHVPQLLALASGHVDTNYSLPSVTQFAQLAMDWRNVRFYQAALTNANYLTDTTGPEGTYILVPDSPDRSWAAVRALAHRLWETPEAGAAMANTEIVVENDTGAAGVAGRVGEVLAKLGYRVGSPTTGTAQTRSRVVDRTGGGQGKALIQQLQADLKVQLDQVTSEKGSGSITLAIGSEDAGLADLAVATDATAPTSAVGITRPSSGPSAAAAPIPAATRAPAPATTPQKTTAPTGSATPLPAHSTTVAPSGGLVLVTPTPRTAPATSSTAHAAPTATPTARRPLPATPTPVRSPGSSTGPTR